MLRNILEFMRDMMHNMFFINPVGWHPVFNGWNRLFIKNFNYKVLCEKDKELYKRNKEW